MLSVLHARLNNFISIMWTEYCSITVTSPHNRHLPILPGSMVQSSLELNSSLQSLFLRSLGRNQYTGRIFHVFDKDFSVFIEGSSFLCPRDINCGHQTRRSKPNLWYATVPPWLYIFAESFPVSDVCSNFGGKLLEELLLPR